MNQMDPDSQLIVSRNNKSIVNQHTGKTHCLNGHEFSPENTIKRYQLGWKRICRACNKLRKDKWKVRNET